jgi:cob(I)alamin adenosyltransferase
MIQLDLFQSEQETIYEQFQKVKESSDSVRRAVFARVNELEKTVKELQQFVLRGGKDES